MPKATIAAIYPPQRTIRQFGALTIGHGGTPFAARRQYPDLSPETRQNAEERPGIASPRRNWLAEKAIRQAKDKDFSEVRRLLNCLRNPYAEQPEFEDYAALPPDWASCLEVSCSS